MCTSDVAATRATALSVFSGVGGLDLGWECATAGRVVGYVERDVFAASLLLDRMEDEALEPAPVWAGDITELDLAPFQGVEWVLGGFPCQDISQAGTGAGISGERSGLWSELFRAYRDSGARYLFAENVSAITIRGLDRVLHDLAEIGCAAEWLCLRASDVGAPHRRERCFILAERVPDAERDALRQQPERGPGGAQSPEQGDPEPRYLGAADVADGDRGRREIEREPERARVGGASGSESQRCGQHRGQRGAAMGDTGGAGLSDAQFRREPSPTGGGQGDSRAAARESGRALFPPGPQGDWGDIEPALQPAIEPGLRVLADGAPLVVDASRADQLRCLGNGVVPLQAAVALRELLRRIKQQ